MQKMISARGNLSAQNMQLINITRKIEKSIVKNCKKIV